MKLSVRRVSLVNDREEMLELFDRNFGDPPYEQRYDWYNKLNPAGPAWTWFVYDSNHQSVVGTTTLFPRRMYVDGKELTVGQVMFFAVNADHRSLGPAVMLQRATFEPVDGGELAFCYDCPPHDEGMSTFVRLGMRPNCEMTRYVLPLRSDEYLGKRIGRGAWTKPLVSTANLLLRMRRSHPNPAGLEISSFEGAFGDEFSHLDRTVSSSGVIRTRRCAAVLNWLFRQFPLRPKRLANGDLEAYHVLAARRGGELLAFVSFFTEAEGFIAICDLFGSQLADVGRPLLDAVIEIGRRQKMQGVYGYCVEGSPLGQLLRRAGFRPRERAARVVAYEKQYGQIGSHLNSGLRWDFSQVELLR